VIVLPTPVTNLHRVYFRVTLLSYLFVDWCDSVYHYTQWSWMILWYAVVLCELLNCAVFDQLLFCACLWCCDADLSCSVFGIPLEHCRVTAVYYHWFCIVVCLFCVLILQYNNNSIHSWAYYMFHCKAYFWGRFMLLNKVICSFSRLRILWFTA